MILQLKYRDRCRFKKSSIILLNIQTLASPMNQKISSVAARREEKKALRWTHTSFEPWNDIHLPVSAAFMNINVSHFSWVASCDRNIQLYFPGWIKKRKWKYESIKLLHLSHKLLLNQSLRFRIEWDLNIRPQNPSCTFWEERWNWEISGKSVKEVQSVVKKKKNDEATRNFDFFPIEFQKSLSHDGRPFFYQKNFAMPSALTHSWAP